MSSYAIVKLGASQYKLSVGDVVVVDRVDFTEGQKYSTDQVFLVVDGDKIEVGAPTVKGVKAEFEVVSHGKGIKVRIHKFKAKSRYKKTTGFRASQTTIKVLSIGTLKAPEMKKAPKKVVEVKEIKEVKIPAKPKAKTTVKKTATKAVEK